jgi:hypothetical protein
VGKLRRERPPVEVALPLREIARTRPEVAAAMESHFRGFCVALPHEEVTAWWTVEHCYRPESLDPTDEVRTVNLNTTKHVHILKQRAL